MKDEEPVYVSLCDKCGPICVTDKMPVDYRRQREHKDANPSHKVYSVQIGWTAQ